MHLIITLFYQKQKLSTANSYDNKKTCKNDLTGLAIQEGEDYFLATVFFVASTVALVAALMLLLANSLT